MKTSTTASIKFLIRESIALCLRFQQLTLENPQGSKYNLAYAAQDVLEPHRRYSAFSRYALYRFIISFTATNLLSYTKPLNTVGMREWDYQEGNFIKQDKWVSEDEDDDEDEYEDDEDEEDEDDEKLDSINTKLDEILTEVRSLKTQVDDKLKHIEYSNLAPSVQPKDRGNQNHVIVLCAKSKEVYRNLGESSIDHVDLDVCTKFPEAKNLILRRTSADLRLLIYVIKDCPVADQVIGDSELLSLIEAKVENDATFSFQFGSLEGCTEAIEGWLL